MYFQISKSVCLSVSYMYSFCLSLLHILYCLFPLQTHSPYLTLAQILAVSFKHRFFLSLFYPDTVSLFLNAHFLSEPLSHTHSVSHSIAHTHSLSHFPSLTHSLLPIFYLQILTASLIHTHTCGISLTLIFSDSYLHIFLLSLLHLL